jgi:hypothetical protein
MLSEETKQDLIMMLLGIKKDSEQKSNKQNKIHSHLIGEYVLVRTYSAGVHIGKLKDRDKDTVLLVDTKRIWYWDGACSLSQLAKEGSKNIDNCKISVTLDENLIDSSIEIIKVSEGVRQQIYGAKEWKK